MSKWTPAPWEVKWYYNVFGPNERLVAACGGRTSNVRDEDAENRANARLISQAPTLATKLQDTVEWLEREIEESGHSWSDEYCIGKLTELRDDLAATLKGLEG